MSPSLSPAKLKLSYPLYSADFDPLNPDFLVVGGGGGYASTGVANKLSLIDVSRRGNLSEIADIELPKDGDSVSSLAIAKSDSSSLVAFAGINSPLAEQKVGKNEHFRSFKVNLPPKKSSSDVSEKKQLTPDSTQALASLSLFSRPASDKNEAYQRVTRTSRPKDGKTDPVVGIASALAEDNEIVVLNAVSIPQVSDKLVRIRLGNAEAADLDFMARGDRAEQSLAYCTEDKVFVQSLALGASTAPTKIYEAPQSAEKSKFRSIRFLTQCHILLLQNKPKKTGAELLILRINDEGTEGQVRLQKRLGTSMKSAVGLDVCLLSESTTGEKQIIVAVAGQNSTVELLTLEFSPSKGMGKFRPYTILRDLHSGPITKICFSNFIPPTMPVSKDVTPQYVKLASVGVDQTVVVHSLPLRPFPPTESKSPRYVLIPPGASESLQTGFSVFMAIFVIGLVALLLQAFTEIRGAVPPTLGATNWLSPRLKDMIARPYIFADGPVLPSEIPSVISVTSQIHEAFSDLPSVDAVTEKLQDLVQQQAEETAPKAIVMRDTAGELAAELHHEADAVKAETVKKWDELTEHEKKGWKRRLLDAGHWSADQGETILKGIFFSELAGAVGDMVRG